jgi:hypothetical protein
MNTFLFAWNAKKWPWPEIDESIGALQRGEEVIEAWRVAAFKRIQPGDRAFMVHVGAEPRGIFGSGVVHNLPYKKDKDDRAHLVDIRIDTLLNPQTEKILTLDILAIGRLAKQTWTPQGSGILIQPEIVEELELVWDDFIHGSGQ